MGNTYSLAELAELTHVPRARVRAVLESHGIALEGRSGGECVERERLAPALPALWAEAAKGGGRKPAR